MNRERCVSVIAYVLKVDMEEGRDGRKNDMCHCIRKLCCVLRTRMVGIVLV